MATVIDRKHASVPKPPPLPRAVASARGASGRSDQRSLKVPILAALGGCVAVLIPLLVALAWWGIGSDGPVRDAADVADSLEFDFQAVAARRPIQEANRQNEAKERQQKEHEARDQAAAEKMKEEENRDAKREEQAAADAEQESKLQTTLPNQRKAEAFAALKQLPEAVATDLPLPNGPSGQFDKVIDLGAFSPDDLIDHSFALAVPSEEIDGTKFNPTIVPTTDANPTEWMIQFSKGVDLRPIHLATLAAEKGRLSIRAGHKNVVKNPAFYYLRRSVLLVKAGDPSKPDEPAKVQRAIQLVRPVMAGELADVSMLPSDEKGSTVHKRTLPFPPAIVPQRGQDRAPALPSRDLTIDYELRFDYEPEGTKKAATYPRGLGATPFQALLNCPPASSIPAEPPTAIGVTIKISEADGAMFIVPRTEGPGKDYFDLGKLALIVTKTDEEYEKWKRRTIFLVKKRVESIRTCPVDMIEKVLNDWEKLKREYGSDIAKFLDDRDPANAFAEWEQECSRILEYAQRVAPAGALSVGTPQAGVGGTPRLKTPQQYEAEMQRPRAEWQRMFSDTIEKWADDYTRRHESEADSVRNAFGPLRSSVKVAVTSISCVAYDADGVAYTVVLATPRDAGMAMQSDPAGQVQ
jgi:hypothetical protein